MSKKSKRNYQVQLNPRGNYIHGEFRIPGEKNAEILVKSPADFTDESGPYVVSFKDVDRAVSSAREAFEIWRFTPQQERFDLLNRYKEALKKREEELSEVIAREAGKPLWEARQEVGAMMAKVDISLTDGMQRISDYEIPSVMPGTLGSCHYRPHGVFVVVGPFNFPGHLANGHIVPALATGNTVIFKPSEKCPGVGQIMTEAFHEAGFPKGVFNLVQGEKEVGRRLCIHDDIDGVLFTGSYEVGLKIKQDTIQQYWKVLALEMGGKNASIVLEDAHFPSTYVELLTSSFLTTGQRCSATSRILVHSSKVDEFIDTFHKKAKGFSIGHPLDNPFMGPLIDESSVEKYLKFCGIAEREGCEIVMRGKQLELADKGNYVTPSICVVKDNSLDLVQKSVYQQTEIFGPNVAIYSFENLDEALRLTNATTYGLAASVYTANREHFKYCFDRLDAGIINWNRSTVGASSRLPFGGVKRSGNHMPTAVSAAQYCVFPVASLEVAEPRIPETLPPGMDIAKKLP